MIAGEYRREFVSKATPDDDRRAQRSSLAKIAVGKPGTFIYMDNNIDDDRRTQTSALGLYITICNDSCNSHINFCYDSDILNLKSIK